MGVDYSTVSQGRKRLREKLKSDKYLAQTIKRLETRLSMFDHIVLLKDKAMNWITKLTNVGHLKDAIIHFNRACEADGKGVSRVEIVRYLSDALNKIKTEWSSHETQWDDGEVKSFQTMITKAINEEDQTDCLRSDDVKNLVYFEPQIMNHDTLRRHQYKPDEEIEPELAKRASEVHKKVRIAYDEFLSTTSDETKKRMLKRLAELLYIVRSNIAHGEKTPYGPDLNKRKRDESVCRVVAPLQKLFINLLLDKPDQKLVVYGTLAPGQPNYGMLERLHGSFEECKVKGSIEEVNQLPFFVWKPHGQLVKAKLFTSSSLPSHWENLDRFEGENYKRILIPVKKADSISIANVYVKNQNSEVQKWEQ